MDIKVSLPKNMDRKVVRISLTRYTIVKYGVEYFNLTSISSINQLRVYQPIYSRTKSSFTFT